MARSLVEPIDNARTQKYPWKPDLASTIARERSCAGVPSASRGFFFSSKSLQISSRWVVFVVLTPLAVCAYSCPTYWGPVIGLMCVLLYSMLDFVDGIIARSTGQTSLLGQWLDGCYDFVVQTAVLCGITMHVVLSDSHNAWLITGVAAVFSQAILVHHTDAYRGVFAHRENVFAGLEPLTGGHKLLLDILMVRSSVAFFIFTHRFWLILLTLLGVVEWFLAVILATQLLRWLVSHIGTAKMLTPSKTEAQMWKVLRADFTKGYP